MVKTRQRKSSGASRKDVASREPNILELHSQFFGFPGIPHSETSRSQLKRQAQVLAGGDPFYDAQEAQSEGRSPKRRKITKLPVGPLKNLQINTLPPNIGKTARANRHREEIVVATSPTAARVAKRKQRERRSGKRRFITADKSTTIGRLELFAWQAEYTQNNSSLAASKNGTGTIPKKSRQAAASRLVFGKGIADVGIWLGKSSNNVPGNDLAQQFSGECLFDGILGGQKMMTKPVVSPCHPRPLQSPRSLGAPPITPPRCNTPQTPTEVDTLYDAVAKNAIVVEGEFCRLFYPLRTQFCVFLTWSSTGISQGCRATEPRTPVSQHQSPKRPREDAERHLTPPCTPTKPPRKRRKETPAQPPAPTVVTRSMRRSMEARGVYLSLTALP